MTDNKITLALTIANTKILGIASSTSSDQKNTIAQVNCIRNEANKRAVSVLFEKKKQINVLNISGTGNFGKTCTAAIAFPEFTDTLINDASNEEISIGDYYGENPNQLSAEFSDGISFFNDYFSL